MEDADSVASTRRSSVAGVSPIHRMIAVTAALLATSNRTRRFCSASLLTTNLCRSQLMAAAAGSSPTLDIRRARRTSASSAVDVVHALLSLMKIQSTKTLRLNGNPYPRHRRDGASWERFLASRATIRFLFPSILSISTIPIGLFRKLSSCAHRAGRCRARTSKRPRWTK